MQRLVQCFYLLHDHRYLIHANWIKNIDKMKNTRLYLILREKSDTENVQLPKGRMISQGNQTSEFITSQGQLVN